MQVVTCKPRELRVKSDPDWFSTCNKIRTLCGRKLPILKVVRNWQRAGCVLPENGPDDSCTRACFRTRCVWPTPDQAIQIGSGPVLYSLIRTFFGRTEPNRMRGVGSGIYTIRPDSGRTLAVRAITGRNQNAAESDPTCSPSNVIAIGTRMSRRALPSCRIDNQGS